ncbi:polysaccharide deacetylase family protein [Phytohabitans sp. ZYX-F-186]|uniref:Polysaccharide deacetylase family protein n=1 Tax=Phytohabitans maris TaxID=3071409 RepID=A0ABU0ZRN9_9ACTN|nr:polysaccharide deacetylase family protein [Phytohabitans sp. ZYX-F-186]MDQ7908915.1 polysaccharide deacetylase family protein [Phytohabitans sp. ZYX-F-186]
MPDVDGSVDVEMPPGTEVIFTIGVAFEAWDGLPMTKMAMTPEFPEEARRLGKTDWTSVSWYEYGATTGLPRLARVFDELDVKVSLSTSARAVELYPDLANQLVAAGHELVGHGYSQAQRMFMLDEKEDLAEVQRCTEILERMTGVRPVGWSSQGGQRGDHTVASLLREGYRYCKDFRHADEPVVVGRDGDRKLIAMPRMDEVNDAVLFRRFGAPPSVYVEIFKRGFDQVRREVSDQPRIVSATLHPTYYGRPFGISALVECVEYARSHPNVWICRRRDAAEYFQRVLD